MAYYTVLCPYRNCHFRFHWLRRVHEIAKGVLRKYAAAFTTAAAGHGKKNSLVFKRLRKAS